MRALEAGLLALSLALLAGCQPLRRATIPVETIAYPGTGPEGQPRPNLLVLLPGRGDGPDAFARRGFVESVRESDFGNDLPFDLVAVDAHLGYYLSHAIVQRLKEDVVDPALAAGYESIHLVGVSLGGLGALLYLREYPREVASVTLLAPYLGDEEFFRYLMDESQHPPEKIVDQDIWPWFLELPQSERDKIYLGYGESDSFAPANELLGTRLDPSHTTTTEGGHSWAVWQKLWPVLLERLKRDASRPDRLHRGSQARAPLDEPFGPEIRKPVGPSRPTFEVGSRP